MTSTNSTLAAAPSAPRNATLIGIGMMVLGIFAYSLNDAIGKWLVSTYTVPQVMAIRGLFAFAMLVPFLWSGRHGIFPASLERPGLQLLRAIAVVGDVGGFYLAVADLPLATVMTYYLAGPIYVTALSPLLLGEHVGWRRWAAVIVGFIGVMIALDPSGAGLGLPEIAAFGSSFCFAMQMIITRKLRGTSETLLITTQVAAPMLVGFAMVPFAWVPPPPLDFVLLGLLGVVSMTAGVCVNRALKLAPASTVVPYQYTFIVWAIVFGYVFFTDIPQPRMLIGAAIIIGAGLFIFLREQRLTRSPPPAPPTAGAA